LQGFEPRQLFSSQTQRVTVLELPRRQAEPEIEEIALRLINLPADVFVAQSAEFIR